MSAQLTKLHHALWVISTLTLSGCVLITPTAPYEPVDGPSSPQASISNTLERVSISDTLTLADALTIALANNPGIARRRYDVEAARALRDRAFGELLPKVELKGTTTLYRDDQIINPRRPGALDTILFSDQQAGADILLRMPLFTGGRLISSIRAASLSRQAAFQTLVHSREELVFNVSSVYYSILAQQQIIHSVHFSHEVLSNHLKHVRERIKVQKAAKVDELRTEVRLADLAQKLVTEKNILAIQTRLLLNFLGNQDESTLFPAIKGDFATPFEMRPQPDRAVAEALVQRKDYQATRLLLEAQAKRVDAARAAHAPSLFLEGSYGDRWDLHDIDRNNEVGGLGLALSFPLFEGGMLEATVRREKALLGALQQRVKEHELHIRLEVETALLNIFSALERLSASQKSIEQATESLRIQSEKYDQAKGTITDVLDAQADLLNAQMNYYRAQADHSSAQAQYLFATGQST